MEFVGSSVLSTVVFVLENEGQAVVVFAALLLLTTLVIESNCWINTVPNGKRELEVKV